MTHTCTLFKPISMTPHTYHIKAQRRKAEAGGVEIMEGMGMGVELMDPSGTQVVF
jgi:hypothetical protein